MTRLIAAILLCTLPASALAHPHDAPDPETPPKIIIKKMMTKGDVTDHSDDLSKKTIKHRILIKNEGSEDTVVQWEEDKEDRKIIGLNRHSRLIDLGDGMVAKLDNGDAVILVDGAVLGADPRKDEIVNVEKNIKIENGRKKTRIVIDIDAPAQ